MASYRNIQQLLNDIQAQVNKLQAGNLTYDELIRLKKVTAELHERMAILEYKILEKALSEPSTLVAEEESLKVVHTHAVQLHADTGVTSEEEKQTEEPEENEESEKQIEIRFAAPQHQSVKENPAVEKTVVEKSVETSPPQTETKPLVEKLKRTKIDDLKTAIPLNQKFLFMNSLFEGENASYNDALDKLNAAAGLEDARLQLRELSYIYGWDFEDDKVISFCEFVERRHL